MFRESPPVNLSPVAAMRQNTPKAADWGALRLLWPRTRPYIGILSIGLAAILAAGAVVLALGQVFRHLVDSGLQAGDAAALHGALFQMLALVFVLAGASYMRLVLLTGTAERIVADLRRAVFNHLLRLDLPWFESQKTGDLVSRLSGDIAVIQILVGTSLPIALRNALLVTGGLAMMALSSLTLSLFVLGIIPVLLAVLLVLGPGLKTLGRTVQEQNGAIAALMAESLGAIRDIQAFVRESLWQTKFAAANDAAIHVTAAYVRRRAMMSSAMITVVFCAICGLIWFGGTQVIDGKISAGELSAFVFYALLVAGSVGALSEIAGDLQRASGALSRIQDLLNAAPQIRNADGAQPVASDGLSAVALENVTFHYPSRPETPALKNISLTIAPGETLAVVGPSGSGKTTLFHLLLRFYDPQQGRVTLDGADSRGLDLAAWRRLFALVPQDPVLFSDSVAANIAFGDPEIAQADIQNAAQQAGAQNFIQNLPQKYDTVLGERGMRLSGGQAQRLALARALLHKSKILLLDEATAHLDSETESAIQNALRHARRNQTTLIIAHRLSTVQHADRIVLLENGQISAIGAHSELLEKSDLYRRLTKTQLQAA